MNKLYCLGLLYLVFTGALLLPSKISANTYTVTSITDSGAGSLRQAITDANANAGADDIVFNITTGMAPYSIVLSSALPNLTGPVTIDGTTQPGFISGTQSTYVKIGLVYTGTIFVSSGVTGITIKGLDISYTTARNGAGISLGNCSQTFVIDNFIRNRRTGIVINGGQDHTIQNNDLLASGENINEPAIYLLNITQGSIPGGVAVSGNKFGGSGNIALRITNMSNLLIGDENVSGAHIVIEDNSGITAHGANGQYLIYLTNVNNITVDNLNLDWLPGGQSNSYGIIIDNQVTNSTITVKNCSIKNRYGAIHCNSGKDYTILNNDLRGCGESGAYALRLFNITAAAVPSGIKASGNLFGQSPTGINTNGGIQIISMNNLLIGDENVAGANITIEDASGLNKVAGNITSDRGALFLQNVSNVTIDNVDASWIPGGIVNAFGIRINNTGAGGNVTIKNCAAKNRYLGIACIDGKDYTITNNDLRGSGHEDNAALNLSGIASGTIPGGVLVHSNLYGRNPTGPVDPNSIALYIGGMNNLTIGDATTGVEIKIEDNSGINTFGGNSTDRRGMLYLDDVSGITVDNLDLSYTLGGTASSFGIYVENETGRFNNIPTSHRNVTIKNCDVRNRSTGIRVRGGKDYSIFNNDLRGSGANNNFAMELGNIQAGGTIPNGVLVHSNTWGTNGAVISHSGLFVHLMNNLTIGDATTGVEIKIDDASGFNQIAGTDVNSQGALYLNSVTNVTVDNVDCSKVTAGQGNTWAIRVANTTSNKNITIKNCLAGNRRRGIWISNGADYTITNNNMVGSGDGQPALELSGIVPLTLTGGIVASGNTFGTPNFHRGVLISNMRDLLIGDASVSGANIVLEDNCGLNQCVGTDYNSHGALLLSAVSNVTVDNVDCSKVTASASNSYGILVSNGPVYQNITIKNCKADNRYRGIYMNGGKDYTVQNNTITNSGWDGEANALDFRNITAGTLTGGVLVSGNTFGNVPLTANVARSAVRFDNMRDLYIGDATTGGNVKLEDGSGLTEVGFDLNSSYSVMALNSVVYSTIDNINLSYSGTNPTNTALRVINPPSAANFTIKDCTINNRRMGIYAAGGRDYTITGNNLTNTGINSSNSGTSSGAAIWLNGLQKGVLDGGISMNNNTFGGTNANCALRIDDMRDFTIGDAMSDDIVFEDGTSGLNNVGTVNASTDNDFVIYLQQVSGITVNSIDVARAGGSQLGGAIRVNNGNGNKNVVFTNNNIGNRRRGIYISGGLDYTITGNNFTGSGTGSSEPAVYLNNVSEGSMTGGISMSGNTFGGTNANTALRLETMKNLTIGDASVSGANIVLEDGTSGLTTVGNAASNNDPVIYCLAVAASTIDNIDLTRTGATKLGTGIRVDNTVQHIPFTIKNCSVGTRRTGIHLNGGKDFTLQNNDLSGSGFNSNEPALHLQSITSPGSTSITGTIFGGTGFDTGIREESCSDLLISDGSVTGSHVSVAPGDGLQNASGFGILVTGCTRPRFEYLDLSYSGATNTGTGLSVASTTALSVKGLTISKRVDGIDITSSSTNNIQCSAFSNNTDAIQMSSSATNSVIAQCSFGGNTAYAINSAATVNAENNYFGGAAPPVGTPNGVTASVDATPFLASAPANCPSVLSPYLELQGNQLVISNGNATPSLLNLTDFNSSKPTVGVSRTFTIKNTGGAPLNITSIGTSGTNAAEFVAGALTPAGAIAPGATAKFTVVFTPSVNGLHTAALDIVSDDPLNNPFSVAIQGTGKNALVVTKVADTNDGVCDADCSLREAIAVANSNADADVIEFNIGTGAQTITHTSAFATISQPLTIDGSTQPGFAGTPLITVNTNNSFTTFNASGVTGLTIKYMNISRPTINYDGNGIDMTNCNEVFILNNVIQNRVRGILSSGGRDHTIQNNDIRLTGVDINNPAIYLSGLTSGNVPGGIKMSGNTFGDISGNNRSRFGIRIANMTGLLIGDASVANANITIEDGSGMGATGTGDNYCLYLESVSNTTVDNLDLSATTYGYQGWGLRIQNTTANSGITVKNCKINTRYSGIYCGGGRDYTILNNDIQATGNDVSRPSLWFNGVTEGAIPKGILASGNKFGNGGGLTRTALRIDGANGLLIGNETISGAHITIEDNSGIKAGGSGDNYLVYLVGVSNTTVNKVDLSSSIGYQGWSLVFSNSANNSNNTVVNCKMNTRYSGVYCIGGKDYTIQNNDLRGTGNDNTRPAIYLSGVRQGAIPGGVTASGNLFGTGTSRTALNIANMTGLLIGDASVSGAHIVIEDNSGANAMTTDGDNAVIYLGSVADITVDNVDISRTAGGRSGRGIHVENSIGYYNVVLKNNKIQQRDVSIWVNNGKDVTIQNNDMRYSGYYTERPTLYLNNIQASALPGGILMSGNLFGGSFNGSVSHLGIRIDNMRDLIISDGSVAGTNITIENTSGLNAVVGEDVSNRGCLYMNTVRNVQISNVDMSKASAGQGNSFALWANGAVNMSVTNNLGKNRQMGFYFSGGRDITVTGNDLTTSGWVSSQPALFFSSVQPGSNYPVNGISVSGNLFGGNNTRTGLRIDNMSNILIGNETVAGAHVVLESTSGMNNIGLNINDGQNSHPALYLANVSDITVDKVDVSEPTTNRDQTGILFSNNPTNRNITIKNCTANRRLTGIYCAGGYDYTVQDNIMLNAGGNSGQPALYMQNIIGRNLPGGVSVSGNTFGGTGAFGGVRFDNMRDLYIGDATTGTNVKLEDNSGLNNLGGNGASTGYYALYLNNVINTTVDNLDISRPAGATPAQDFTGVRVDNGASYGPVTIKNCDVRRHKSGIYINGGKDFTITGNDLRGTGAGNNSLEPAIYISSISQDNGTVPMGILANNNLFGTANGFTTNVALVLADLGGIRISDGSVPNTHIALEATSGINEATGSSNAVLYFNNTSGISVEKLNLDFTGTQTGTGIRFNNNNASQFGNSIKDNTIKNRRMGLYILNGADYTVTGNDFRQTGAADDEPAIRAEHIAEGSLYGGLAMSNNQFGGTGAAFAMKFVNMSNLKISDGTYPATNINLGTPATNGFYNVTSGNLLHLSGVCNAVVSTLDLSRAGTVRQGTGLRMNGGLGNSIEKILVGNRDKGIEILNGSTTQSFTCNTLFDNNFGIDIAGTLSGTNTFTNNSFDCNGTGLRSTSNAAVNAQNNFWGTANGPTNLGGSGDSYTGTVTASPYLAAAAACSQPLPDLETKGNSLEIVDGDITPSFDDHTQYCAVNGFTMTRVYTLKNTGNGIMNLTGANPVTLSPASGTPFTITTQPADVELLPGETTTFSVLFAPVTLGAFNATLNVASRDCRENAYNFAIKGQGCVDIQATLSGTQAICFGQSANLTINISDGLAPFMVKLSDGSMFTVNNIGDNIVSVTPSSTTTYTIESVMDANGCCSGNNGSATVTVNPLPTPAITIADMSGNTNDDGTICADATATLDAGAYVLWAWSNLANTQTITTGNAGTYTVTVTDNNGCTATDSEVITVNPLPTPAIAVTDMSGNMNDDGILCTGATATLDAGTYAAWAWSTLANTQTISTGTAGTYTVTVTDNNNCSATDDQSIVVNVLPAASLSGNLLICPGTPTAMIDLDITAGTAPFTVVLSDGSSHNVAASGMSQLTVNTPGMGPLTFTITSITDANGCSDTGTGSATVTFGSLGEIEIAGNGNPIADGDNMPDTGDNTDFGTTTGAMITKTFTITNSDPVNALNINGLSLSGSSQFTVVTPPAAVVAANGGTTTFTIKFTPSTPGAASSMVNVNSSDCDEEPYDFVIAAFFDCTPAMFTACPGNVIVNTATGLCNAVVNYTATVSGTPVPSVNYTFSGATVGSGTGTGSGTAFNSGVTMVSIAATNPCGAPVCAFTVTVEDHEAPVVTCPPAATVINTDPGAGCTIVIPNYISMLTATDNCSTVTEAQSIPAGAYSTGVFDGAVITVNYTATDGASPANTTTCTVAITVNDNVAPVVTCPPATAVINTEAGPGCTIIIPDYVTALTATDNCSAVTEMQSIPAGAYSTGVTHGAVINVSYTATDGASPANATTCNVAITVNDNVAPQISGPSNTTTAPTPGFCSAIVNGIDAVYSDNCTVASFGYVLTGATSGSGAGQASGLQFEAGVTNVTYTVTDGAGLTATHSFTVTVSACVQISGNIRWENNNMAVKDASVQLSLLPGATPVTSTLTNNAGNYTLNAGPAGDFRITPTKNINPLNGVTSADASRIQQHITSNPPLNGPYKRIAADINKSNSITTVDAQLVTQALAGNPTALAHFNNSSWRFVPASYIFPNPNVPWGFPEKIDLTGITSNQINQNFIGVKLGDVNGTANPLLKPGAPVVWAINDAITQQGKILDITFDAAQFDDVAAFQFALHFNPEVLEFTGAVSNGVLDMSADNFGTFNAQSGELRVVWNTVSGRTLNSGAGVFTLRFKALETGFKLSEILGLDEAVLHGASWNSELVETGLAMVYREVSAAGEPNILNDLILFQNTPNPFVGQTKISFTIPQSCDGQLRIIDISGRVVAEVNKTWQPGYHVELFDLTGHPGVLICELKTPYGVRTKKMIQITE